MVLEAFKVYFDAKKGGAKSPELKVIYNTIRVDFNELPKVSTLGGMEEALREYEENAPDSDKVLIDSEDNFYGSIKAGKLNKFLDYIYVPAVKDMTRETENSKGSVFSKLLTIVANEGEIEESIEKLNAETKAKVDGIVKENKADLDVASEKLTGELQRWAHPETSIQLIRKPDDNPLKMPNVFSTMKEGSFEGNIDKFGHGLHRSFLFALLNTWKHFSSQADVVDKADEREVIPKVLIFAIEEPELYQHPFQIRKIASVLRDLSDNGKIQTILTTHSPLLLQPDLPGTIKRITKKDSVSEVQIFDSSHIDWFRGKIPSDIYRLLNENVSEMLFADKVVLVEGKSDIPYIRTYWSQTRDAPFPLPIISFDGKDKIKPIKLARAFGIDTFVIFDMDNGKNPNQEMLSLLDIDIKDVTSNEIFVRDTDFAWPKTIEERINAEMQNFDQSKVKKEPLKIAERLIDAMQKGDKSPSMEKLLYQL